MLESEGIIKLTIWSLTGIGMFFGIRTAWRRRRQAGWAKRQKR